MKKLSLAMVFAGMMSLFFALPAAEAGTCPRNCVSWYDGCNTCACKNGRTTICTKRACKKKGRAYCRQYVTLTCANVRCAKPRRCQMVAGKPRCLCPKVAIKCAKGYTVAYKVVGGCRLPYCRKVTITCANVRCAKPRRCQMIGGKPRCLCPRLAIRCAPGYTVAYKVVGGCRLPYCKKTCTNRCPLNCSVWHDGCNDCRCVKGCITACTKKACFRKGRAYCKRR